MGNRPRTRPAPAPCDEAGIAARPAPDPRRRGVDGRCRKDDGTPSRPRRSRPPAVRGRDADAKRMVDVCGDNSIRSPDSSADPLAVRAGLVAAAPSEGVAKRPRSPPPPGGSRDRLAFLGAPGELGRRGVPRRSQNAEVARSEQPSVAGLRAAAVPGPNVPAVAGGNETVPPRVIAPRATEAQAVGGRPGA